MKTLRALTAALSLTLPLITSLPPAARAAETAVPTGATKATPAPAPAVTATDEDPAPPANRPKPEDLRGRFRNLSPEEREARLKELRSRFNPGATNRTEVERRREEWRKLPPAEREARIKELRERNLSRTSPLFNRLTPAEREAKRGEIKERVDTQIKELEARKATAPLTALEQRRLDRFREMARRLDQGTALGLPPRGTNRPSRTTPPAQSGQPAQPAR